MSNEVTEHEAISRFIENTKEAAVLVRSMENTDLNKDSVRNFSRIMKGASGSAQQLYYMQQNPDFLNIRDQLEILTKQASILALNKHIGTEMKAIHGVSPFEAVSNMLSTISDIGARLATSKAVTRDVVLHALDERQNNITNTGPH